MLLIQCLKGIDCDRLDLSFASVIIASSPVAKRETLMESFILKLESMIAAKNFKFFRDGYTFYKSSDTVRYAVTNSVSGATLRRMKEVENAMLSLGLLDPDDTSAEKQKRLEAQTKAIKELEVQRKDQATFSSTFSKARQRTFVQGGAPGLKK
jgi:hypothetical protein